MLARLEEGLEFHGRYRVIRRINAGGMGAVYEVLDARSDRRRALKILHPSYVEDERIRSKFEAEAKVTGQIESEHLVEVFDAGIDPTTGCPYIVMELLRGEDMGAIARRGPVHPKLVVMLLSQIARALDKTHKAGIVHRDLKPENLFVSYRDDGSPRARVMDFGIAKVVAGTGQASSSAVVGTPTYMAPEQIRESAAIGPATDLYALGHIAYTLLTGRAYWSEEKSRLDLVPFLLGVASGAQEAPSARAARSGVALPPAFDVWFARATATDPRQRFSLASAMIAELSVALELPSGAAAPTPSAIPPGHSAAVATPAELGVTPPTVSTEDGASVARPVSSTPRRRSVLVLAFASIAGAGVGAALWIGSLRSTTTGSPPSQPAAAATSAAPLAVAAKEQSTAAPAESERPAVAPSPSEAPTIASSAAAPSSSARAPARAPAAPPAKPARKGEGLL